MAISGVTFEITRGIPKLAFQKLITYKTLITKEEILAALTGDTPRKGYRLKKITNIKAVTGGADLAQELSGLAIHIKKQAGIFTADLVLRHPKYLDTTLTGVTFEKEKAFVFDKKTKTISRNNP